MLRTIDGLLGHNHNETMFYSGADSEELYNKNLLKFSQDWYYRNTNISYTYNEYGHRTAPVADINLSNYILFVGCSHTEGIGLKLEDTYPNVVSKKLGIDYYNLAVGGTGTQVMQHNLVTWLTKYNFPKAIVWQWSHPARFSSYSNKFYGYRSIGPWVKEEEFQKILVQQEITNFNKTRDMLASQFLLQLQKRTPIICTTLDELTLWVPTLPHTLKLSHTTEMARDQMHYGIYSHNQLAEQIITRYNEMLVA